MPVEVLVLTVVVVMLVLFGLLIRLRLRVVKEASMLWPRLAAEAAPLGYRPAPDEAAPLAETLHAGPRFRGRPVGDHGRARRVRGDRRILRALTLPRLPTASCRVVLTTATRNPIFTSKHSTTRRRVSESAPASGLCAVAPSRSKARVLKGTHAS
jgi:hypothetical protein